MSQLSFSSELMTPYVGITGFTTLEEVEAVVQTLPAAPPRLLMCGVLLSNALLMGETSDAPGRCPSPESIAGIFSPDPRCLNLVHYRPQAASSLADVLTRAAELGGDNCHGLQINATRGAPWPAPAEVHDYRSRSQPRRVVLQVGGEAMASVGGEAGEIARKCAEYEGVVTDVLVDASEGMGVPLDTDRTARYLTEIAEAAPNLGLVVAGGLHSDNLAGLLSPLLPKWAGVSIDAEGRLRDSQDRLSTTTANLYLKTAIELLDGPAG